jgi:hypothetical protein
VARDATARQYDVDADSVGLDIKKGLITFRAKKGRLVDLDKLHESIWATRLSGSTGMRLHWMDVTVVGAVVVEKKATVLKVAGSDQHFVLKPGSNKAAFERLEKALARGDKVASVTGRLEGWSGHFPKFLKALPSKPYAILVTDFELATNGRKGASRPKGRDHEGQVGRPGERPAGGGRRGADLNDGRHSGPARVSGGCREHGRRLAGAGADRPVRRPAGAGVLRPLCPPEGQRREQSDHLALGGVHCVLLDVAATRLKL